MLPAQGSAFGLLVLFVVDQRNAPSDGARSALVLGLIMAVNVSALVIRFRGATVMLEIELHTPRLLLRGWQTTDLRGFAALNADPEVMRYFPSVMSRAQSDAMARRIQAHFALHGFGQWVLERREQPGLIGALGLQQVNFEAAFTPAVEIGWRLQRAHWRQGYAREAAEAVLAYAFESLQLKQLFLDVCLSCCKLHRSPSRKALLWFRAHRKSGEVHPELSILGYGCRFLLRRRSQYGHPRPTSQICPPFRKAK